jgi:signal transduction histidine kinase
MDAARFLANTISILSTSADFRTTIDNLSRLAASGLADWCGIFMFENEQTIRRLAVAPPPHIEGLYPLDLHASTGPAHVRRTGRPELLTEITSEAAESLGFKPGELVLADGRNLSICLCMPVVARDRTIGAIVFMRTEPKNEFNESDLELAASLANAAAVAIDSAKLSRDAQEANRLKDEFVAMVSHELRTPLTPILGCIHLLRTAKLTQANFDRALEMIDRSANTQVQIVEDLLDVSRIVAGKLHLTMKPTPLIPVLQAAIDSVRPLAEAKNVTIVTNYQDIQPIDGDSHRLQQIIWNLLSNAVKFTPPEGRIEISLRTDDDHVQIQVIDTGIGIPADLLPYIFDRFRQAHDGHSKMRSGLGLGLAIVRHLVELHHGSIGAASAGPGQGSVFTLRFPFTARKAAIVKS